jgi:hypothetical protein
MPMRPTRKIIVEFIGVFVLGAVAGGLLSYIFTDTQLSSFMSRTTNPDQMAARINKKYTDQYNLTPDELQRIQPLVKDMAQHVSQIRHQFGVDVLSTMDDYHQQIAAQLTPEHRDAYLKAMVERKKVMTSLLLPDQASPTAPQP